MAATSQSDATSDASEAAAGVGSRRTTSNLETEQRNVDIGADEAFQSAILNQTRSWNSNDKLTYDDTLKALSSQENELQVSLGELRTVKLELLKTMATNSDNIQKRYLTHLSLEDRSVFTAENELEANLAAKTGIQADALAAIIVKAVGDAVNAVKP